MGPQARGDTDRRRSLGKGQEIWVRVGCSSLEPRGRAEAGEGKHDQTGGSHLSSKGSRSLLSAVSLA